MRAKDETGPSKSAVADKRDMNLSFEVRPLSSTESRSHWASDVGWVSRQVFLMKNDSIRLRAGEREKCQRLT
jgi:hypothetical protein